MKNLIRQRGLLGISLILMLSLVCVLLLASGVAQSQRQQETKPVVWQERIVGPKRINNITPRPDTSAMTEHVIENQLPSHLPIRVELKNLDAAPMLRHLEVKITNLSKKPIYFLVLHLDTPEIVGENSAMYGFDLTYNRMELLKFDEPLRYDDAPWPPGETRVLKIPENHLEAFEQRLAERKLGPSDLKLLYLSSGNINFGDGTGFRGIFGAPYPKPNPRSEIKVSAQKVRKKQLDFKLNHPPAAPLNPLLSNSDNLISLNKTSGYSIEPGLLPNCCWTYPGWYCSWMKDDTYACNCGTGATFQLASCNDLSATCAEAVPRNRECVINGYTFTCTVYLIVDCPPRLDLCRSPYKVQPADAPDAPDAPCINCCTGSPIIIDVLGNGYRLTDTQGGVNFDLNLDGTPERMAWTKHDTDDAFLVLDRNGNGTIDHGGELFGNYSPQPPSENPNGFISLAEFDKPAQGGDGNGKINGQDAVFSSLRLWQDFNHNGVSESSELRSLPALGVRAIDLDYRESRRMDEYGNHFKYRAKVYDEHNQHVGKWAWDVWLMVEQ